MPVVHVHIPFPAPDVWQRVTSAQTSIVLVYSLYLISLASCAAVTPLYSIPLPLSPECGRFACADVRGRLATAMPGLPVAARAVAALPLQPREEWVHMDVLEEEKLRWTGDLPAAGFSQTDESHPIRNHQVLPPLPPPPTHPK